MYSHDIPSYIPMRTLYGAPHHNQRAPGSVWKGITPRVRTWEASPLPKATKDHCQSQAQLSALFGSTAAQRLCLSTHTHLSHPV